MSEKRRTENSDLDFSKLEDQQKLNELPKEEKDRLANDAQDEANLIELEIDSEAPLFVSDIVKVIGDEEPDLTKEPFGDFNDLNKERVSYYKKDDPNIETVFTNGPPDNVADDYIVKKESLNLDIDLKNIAPFEARYVVYGYAVYGEIVEKMKELGWDTPTFEQAILFATKDKKFRNLIVLDEKRGREFSIDARVVAWGTTQNYSIGVVGDLDLEDGAVPDREILFVRAEKPEDNEK